MICKLGSNPMDNRQQQKQQRRQTVVVLLHSGDREKKVEHLSKRLLVCDRFYMEQWQEVIGTAAYVMFGSTRAHKRYEREERRQSGKNRRETNPRQHERVWLPKNGMDRNNIQRFYATIKGARFKTAPVPTNWNERERKFADYGGSLKKESFFFKIATKKVCSKTVLK